MKFSFNWLKRWVEIDLDVDEFSRRLTASGLEVDGVKPVTSDFEGVVAAAILDCRPHPDADKLVVCTVDAGDEKPLQIVCGAPNARAGLVAPLAREGARLGDEFEVKKVDLRGVESHGMLCSAKELGLGDDHSGLLELPGDAEIGRDLVDLLETDDFQITLDLTPNRSDCLSIRGIARDVSASCGVRFIEHESEPVPAEIDDELPIRLESPEDCPRYVGRIIKGIDGAAKSPLWIREALRRCGLRAISPVVDVTNFVLLELGQPMHAFDLARIEGEIVVRRGRPGEKLVLLDEQEVELDESVLAICDGKRPVALGGIMGGLESGVTAQTQDVLFEAAWFRPATIMGKARDYGLHTDASHRFERGVDTNIQVRAMERATELLTRIAGGSAGPVMVAESSEYLPVNGPVKVRVERLNLLLGTEISGDEAGDILRRLNMQLNQTSDGWEVVAPSSRFDIAIEEDLIEEVARIYGYDRIPEAKPTGVLSVGSAATRNVPLSRIRDVMNADGFQEAINYSFVDPALLESFGMAEGALPLANPLASDMAVMRTSLIPGLVVNLGRNTRRQQGRVRLFETGVAFVQAEKLIETQRIAAVACGSAQAEQWGEAEREVDFYDIKGEVERLLGLRGQSDSIRFESHARPCTHPGASARIYLESEGNSAEVGWCAVLHPAVLKAMEIRQAVVAFELDLDMLQRRDVQIAKEYSRFPSIRRDLALEVPEGVDYASVRECVKASTGELLKNLVLFDVYEGQNLTKGYKSLAIGLILQHVSSTLTDETIDDLVRDTVSELTQRLGARLRG